MSNTFIHYLGGFYFQWSLFEIHVEMICLKELGITPRQVHILLGSLSFSSKQEVAISLLKEGDNPHKTELISALKRIPQIARRNHITHSLITTNSDFSRFTFTKREIANGLKQKELSFDIQGMRGHFHDLNDAVTELVQLCSYSHAEMQAYVDSVKTNI